MSSLAFQATLGSDYLPVHASVSMTSRAIKNTFIHFSDDDDADASARRHSSLPPSTRFRGSIGIEADRKQSADSFSEVEISTNCTEDDVSSVTADSEHGLPSDAEVEHVGNSSQAAAVEAITREPSGIRLRSSAMAWNPGVRRLQPRSTCMFAEQIETLLMIMKTTLVTCAWIHSLDIKNEGTGGWSVVATMLPENLKYKDEVLRLAKASLLQATGSLTQICMMGCHTQPFVAMPLGFAALFAGVANRQQACWSLLQKGFCNYGCHCRWEHPAYQRKVYVKVMLPASP